MVPLWESHESGVRVVHLTEPDEVEALVRLFEAIAKTEGWLPKGALRRWTDRSTYFAVSVDGQIAGGLQLVNPDALGTLPCHDLWPETPVVGSNRSAHAAILAVGPSFRGRNELFWMLCVEAWRYCVIEGIASLFLEVTPRVLPFTDGSADRSRSKAIVRSTGARTASSARSASPKSRNRSSAGRNAQHFTGGSSPRRSICRSLRNRRLHRLATMNRWRRT
jgi:hypothetical protein